MLWLVGQSVRMLDIVCTYRNGLLRNDFDAADEYHYRAPRSRVARVDASAMV